VLADNEQYADMRTAIVTMTLGMPFELVWNEVCEPTWRAYAARHGYDVIAINRPLDTSIRAALRSPAWQKLLVLRPEVANGYDRIVWVDADVVINSEAPAIAEGVPLEKVGAVDEATLPTREENRALWEHVAETAAARLPSDPQLVAAVRRSAISPAEWHGAWGLPARGNGIVQTGVMVLSPKHHCDLFEFIYRTYECKVSPAFNLEMRPTSFEIQERGLVYWIDKRFNALANMLMLSEHRRCPITTRAKYVAALRRYLAEHYFLHFAGLKESIGELKDRFQ
jgi:hypothetical protein